MPDRLTGNLNGEPGEHVWVIVASWRIFNPEEAHKPEVIKYLDLENLASMDGPGCFVCEQVWTAEIGAAPCPGEPR